MGSMTGAARVSPPNYLRAFGGFHLLTKDGDTMLGKVIVSN